MELPEVDPLNAFDTLILACEDPEMFAEQDIELRSNPFSIDEPELEISKSSHEPVQVITELPELVSTSWSKFKNPETSVVTEPD
jgi:hypothetical protein